MHSLEPVLQGDSRPKNPRPATQTIDKLLPAITSYFRQCTRNKQKLYRISTRFREIRAYIDDLVLELESASGCEEDISIKIDRNERFLTSMKTLEE